MSNAKLQPTLAKYSTYENEYSWTIDNSTPVQQVQEAEPPIIPDVFNFTDFNRIYEHIDTNNEIDLVGIAIHVHPLTMRGGTRTREVIIVDQSSQPKVLTLWGEHESDEGQAIADSIHTEPVIAALTVKVTSYHSLLQIKEQSWSLLPKEHMPISSNCCLHQ